MPESRYRSRNALIRTPAGCRDSDILACAPYPRGDAKGRLFSFREEYWKRIFRTNERTSNNELTPRAEESRTYHEYNDEHDRSSTWVVEERKWADAEERGYSRRVLHSSYEYPDQGPSSCSTSLGIVFGFGAAVYLIYVFFDSTAIGLGKILMLTKFSFWGKAVDR
ncbi:hypothetical protein BO78DRAFT_431722 [Aspergillus sclerotiicarbonarius CBS 121057]|uniref:Uncharacterized protein n=1 Tax=Aspergillus sclerotiicarbonarius (strain CBS 121057 / IBT 28362) TaxID=1448318 RepID=A0A319E1R7_ASPSB|nr:hypothetical protein BO78DRAFT_431722 [Aspergillus sclerotiicarbonarius CBS 121057]